MRSYAEKTLFSPEQVLLHQKAEILIENSPDELFGPNLLRCHELAAAVGIYLDLERHDGYLRGVQHSWLTIGPYSDMGGVVLDVYMPGSLPQVQLIETRTPGSPYYQTYKIGRPRTDIKADQVQSLIQVFRVIQAEAETEGLWP